MNQNKIDIKQVEKNVENNPLETIDEIISIVSDVRLRADDYSKILKLLLTSIFKFCEIKFNQSDLEDAVFRNDLGFDNQKFISVCLLRILNANDEILNSFSNKYKVFKLFDETLPDIYKARSIEIKEENHLKENKLKDFIKNLETEINSKLIIENLNSIDKFENNLYKNLNLPINRLLFNHFIPIYLTDKNKLKDIFQLIKDYKSSQLVERLNLYEKASEYILSYISEIEKYKTKYCIEILLNPFQKILELVKNDFDTTPFIKHAELQVFQSEKKYPFSQINADFKIGLIIRNIGEGFAYNAQIKINSWTNNIVISKAIQDIGQIDDNQMIVEYDCKVIEKEDIAIIIGELIWFDYKSSLENKKIFEFDLVAQKADIDWDKLKFEDPYSSEAVETQDKLVGRNEIVNNLLANIKNKVGSFYIFGQKRVGKTSIVRTLKTIINNNQAENFIVLYIEGGEYTDKLPEKTLVNLAQKICNRIKNSDKRLKNIEIPAFDNSFTPVSDFLDNVLDIVSDVKILIILDEFDEISQELYKRTEIGNSFFLTLRAISNKSQFGFWFVGGEKMEFLISCQGEQLNKFQSIRVDYFDKENSYPDFIELVRKPVSQYFEITDNAVNKLYNFTAGNPFFTKVICRHLFNFMVNKRDNHITEAEMKQAINIATNKEETQIFAHFWEDGIKVKGNEEEEISMRRRKILLAVAYSIKEYDEAKKEIVLTKCVNFNISEQETIATLREFEERQILICKKDIYNFKVAFFGKWLLEKGIEKIITTLSEADKIGERKKRELELRITAKELVELSEKWQLYKGQQITTEKIRVWLEQFDNILHQRTVFKILQNITFYTDFAISVKMEEIYKTVKKGLVLELKEGRKKRDDILVSYLDAPGKSGAEYAKLFADKNDIYFDKIVEPDLIERNIIANKNIKALVFIDDFSGSGTSICDYLTLLHTKYPLIFESSKLKLHIGIVCGFNTAKQKIEDKAKSLNIELSVIICDILDERDKCFSEKSKIFTDNTERMNARAICYDKGSLLEKHNPLGYGECQATIVFSKTCPNNTLPILWQEKDKWSALFKRL